MGWAQAVQVDKGPELESPQVCCRMDCGGSPLSWDSPVLG